MKIDHWQFDDYDLIIDRVDKHLKFNIMFVSFDVDDKWLMHKLDRYASLVSKGIACEYTRPLYNDIDNRIRNILEENKELIENVDK